MRTDTILSLQSLNCYSTVPTVNGQSTVTAANVNKTPHKISSTSFHNFPLIPAIDCGQPPNISHASLQFNSTDLFSDVAYTCEDEFFFEHEVETGEKLDQWTYSCNENRTWLDEGGHGIRECKRKDLLALYMYISCDLLGFDTCTVVFFLWNFSCVLLARFEHRKYYCNLSTSR